VDVIALLRVMLMLRLRIAAQASWLCEVTLMSALNGLKLTVIITQRLTASVV
jgi:hypothetical protein